MALPSNMSYGQKSTGAPCLNYRSNILADQQTYTEGDIITLSIPTGTPGTYLNQAMSYLKFRVKNKSSVGGVMCAMQLNACGAYSFIRSMRLSHNGLELEYIDNLNALVAFFLDNLSNSNKSQWGFSMGINDSGYTDEKYRSGVLLGASSSYYSTEYNEDPQFSEFCIPLFGSCLSTSCDKMLPLGLMNGDLRLELTLANNAMYNPVNTENNTIVSYEINNVELVLDILQLDSQYERSMRKEFGNELSIHGNGFTCHTLSLQPSAGTQSLLISARNQSLKSLYFLPFYNSVLTNPTRSGISCRNRDNMTTFQLQLGQYNVPQKAILMYSSEVYVELQKSLHNLYQPNTPGCMPSKCYWADADTAKNTTVAVDPPTTTSLPCYAFGLDLDNLSYSSDLIQSGVNTTSFNTFLNITSNNAITENMTIFAFSHYDTMLIIDSMGQARLVK